MQLDIKIVLGTVNAYIGIVSLVKLWYVIDLDIICSLVENFE